MSYVKKLVERIENSNKGMVVKAVGITQDGEIKIVKTSRNANAYKTMVKNSLVELYLNGVHHKMGLCVSVIESIEESMNDLCDAGDYMVGLEKYGVDEGRARHLSEDLYKESVCVA